MYRSDSGTSQNSNGELRYHREVYTNSIPFFLPLIEQYVSHPTSSCIQFVIGNMLRWFFRIVGLKNKGRFITSFLQVTVDAVFGDIEFSIDKPLALCLLHVIF